MGIYDFGFYKADFYGYDYNYDYDYDYDYDIQD